MSGRRAVRLVVHGHVQGVNFRSSVEQEATRVGAAGWVRNLDDGTVEVHAEGGPDAVDAVEAFAGHGPSAANVEHIERREVDAEGLEGFETR